MSAIDVVKKARELTRPTGRVLIDQIFTGFTELHGDRRFGDDKAIIGGIGYLDGRAVTVICVDKGATTAGRIAANFGSPHPEGYRKALRLMKQAEKFGRPVVCLIDTAGAYCGIGAEERGQALAIAENLCEMMFLKTSIVSVIVGEGGSGGALALAVADKVFMMKNSIYSVISPEGCASILWKDPGKIKEAAESLKLTAEDLLKLGVIDEIISEEKGIGEEIKAKLITTLKSLCGKEHNSEARYQKFRVLGK